MAPHMREDIERVLLDPSLPIEERYRALFYAKSAPESMCALMLSALDVQTSILLRHEIAYVLGQIGNMEAAAALCEILEDEGEDEIVRHEAAEALGALRVHCDSIASLANETTPLGQTCLIALKTVTLESKPCPCQYASSDPAIGVPGATEKDVPAYAQTIISEESALWDRYVAMFTLRNVGGANSVHALCRALLEDTTSALLRHEVAFVLGQMESPEATEALIQSLGRSSEHSMVRHEAAIALGSIGGEEAKVALENWISDRDELVRESCVVALATMKYWEEWEALEARMKESL